MDAAERERNLQAIGDVIEYWIKWVAGKHGGDVAPDTYVILGLENAPPVWPSIGQLTKWLEVLRDRAPPPSDTRPIIDQSPRDTPSDTPDTLRH